MWDWLIWGALIAGALAVLVAAARLGVVALRAWRDLKRTRRRLFKELDTLLASADALAVRAETLAEAGDRIPQHLEQLDVSRRRLAVLREALDEATDTFGWIAVVRPRK